MGKFGPPVQKETLVQFLLKYKFQFLTSSLAGIIYNTAIVLGPIFLGKLIDASYGGTSHIVWLSALYFVGVTVFFQFSRFIKRWFMRDQFNHVACDLRQTLLERVMKRRLPQLDKETVGDLMSRTVGDITLVVDTVMSTINEGWDTWLLMISYFAVLLYMDWKITLLASLLVPVTLMLAHMMRHVLYQCSLDARKSVSTANTGLQRYLSAVSDLRLFGRESAETEGIIDAYERQVNLNIKQTLLQQSLLPVYALLAGVGVVIVIALGGGNVKSGEWTIGTFNAYMVMFVAFTGRTRVAAKVFNKWHSAKAAWVRVKEKMVIDGAVTTKDDPLRIVTGINQIKINNLQFAYGDRPILKDINFNIKAGEIIGITGAIGSGKSTLLNVLTGQYDYEGQILFDQIHLNELSEETKQAMIGYSGHDSFLFSMSIEDNIHFSTSQVNSAEMEKCVTSVALKDDLERFENRLQTEVGEKGLKVSGGQKQRIAMARAIYNQPPLVLLDDPFSALDIATERRIVDRLRQDFKNQMVVIATHRLSVFEYVDRVLVLDQGKIIESGTHPELMRQKGLYAEIFNAQQFIEGGAANETCTE